MNIRWKQLGGQAGIGLAIAGFLLIFLGWNGAATYDRGPAQFPYLISGGMAGLALVVLAASLIVVNAQRQDRAALLNSLAELKEAVDRMALATAGSGVGGDGVTRAGTISQAEAQGLVIAGPTTFHRPSCKLLEGRGALPAVSADVAEQRGLTACRACDAADYTLPVAERDASDDDATPARRRRTSRSTP